MVAFVLHLASFLPEFQMVKDTINRDKRRRMKRES